MRAAAALADLWREVEREFQSYEPPRATDISVVQFMERYQLAYSTAFAKMKKLAGTGRWVLLKVKAVGGRAALWVLRKKIRSP